MNKHFVAIVKRAKRPIRTFMQVEPTAFDFFCESNRPSKVVETSSVFDSVNPVVTAMRLFGCLPIKRNALRGYSAPIFTWIRLYSIVCFFGVTSLLVYTYIESEQGRKSDRKVGHSEKFSNAVNGILYTTLRLPVLFFVIVWYETPKVCSCFNEWRKFEVMHRKFFNRPLTITYRKQTIALLLTFGIFSILFGIRAYFIYKKNIISIAVYFSMNYLTNLIVILWFVIIKTLSLTCDHMLASFNKALASGSPAVAVSNHRVQWIKLSCLIREIGNSVCYTLMFTLILILLGITLSLYGLFIQNQTVAGVDVVDQDLGQAVDQRTSEDVQEKGFLNKLSFLMYGAYNFVLLYLICDDAHHIAAKMQRSFREKILEAELVWMNFMVETEVNIFLKATDMNATAITLGGFVTVDRHLFKSLVTVTITYLVILLQFQISSPSA